MIEGSRWIIRNSFLSLILHVIEKVSNSIGNISSTVFVNIAGLALFPNEVCVGVAVSNFGVGLNRGSLVVRLALDDLVLVQRAAILLDLASSVRLESARIKR